MSAGWSFSYKGGRITQTFVASLKKRLHLVVDYGARPGFSKRKEGSI
jgi:hypothetical protein